MNDRTSFLSLIGGMAIAISIVSPSHSNPVPSAEQKILGTWQATVEGVRGTLIFAPDNKLFMIQEGVPAFLAKYQLNTQTKPMELDLIDGQKKVSTIFEFTNDNKLRIEANKGMAPGNTRPKTFSSEAIVFQKVSDSTSLPPNIRVENDENSEARENMRSIAKAQTVYQAENERFADNFNLLALDDLRSANNEVETENYFYKIVVSEKNKTMTTAAAKTDDLKSYVGINYRYQNSQGQAVISWVVCESKEPNTTVPTPQLEAIPKAPPTCPSGYVEVEP
jgi:hypothetical protein